MKKLKYLVLILMIFLFSGCSGSYNLTFNKDLTLEEKLDVLIENEENYYEKTIQMFEKAGIDEREYSVRVIDNQVNVVYIKKYRSFTDYYLNSNLYKTLFEEIEFKKDKTGIKINAESNLKLDDKDKENIINSFDIDELEINIKMPFYVEKNNADKVKDATYTWNINRKDTYKNINIEYTFKNDRLQSIVTLVLIGISSLVILIYLAIHLVRNQRI